jgi:hypothetical protein
MKPFSFAPQAAMLSDLGTSKASYLGFGWGPYCSQEQENSHFPDWENVIFGPAAASSHTLSPYTL